MPITTHAGDYTAQLSEVVILLMALALTPGIARSLRDVRLAGKRAFMIGYLALVGSFAATVAEGYLFGPFFNFSEHALTAVAGVAFAFGAWQVLSDVRARGSGT